MVGRNQNNSDLNDALVPSRRCDGISSTRAHSALAEEIPRWQSTRTRSPRFQPTGRPARLCDGSRRAISGSSAACSHSWIRRRCAVGAERGAQKPSPAPPLPRAIIRQRKSLDAAAELLRIIEETAGGLSHTESRRALALRREAILLGAGAALRQLQAGFAMFYMLTTPDIDPKTGREKIARS